MKSEVLKLDDWEQLVQYCEKRKIEVPDRDTSFVAVSRNDEGAIVGMVPVQAAYAAGPFHGTVAQDQLLKAIDDHFALHFAMYGAKYFVFHPETAHQAIIRTLKKPGR